MTPVFLHVQATAYSCGSNYVSPGANKLQHSSLVNTIPQYLIDLLFYPNVFLCCIDLRKSGRITCGITGVELLAELN